MRSYKEFVCILFFVQLPTETGSGLLFLNKVFFCECVNTWFCFYVNILNIYALFLWEFFCLCLTSVKSDEC